MTTDSSFVSHEALKHKARYYKSELLMQLFGVTVSAAVGSEMIYSTSTSGMSDVPTYSNIVGVGYGAKQSNGSTVDGQEAVRVYVRRKLPRADLGNNELIPSYVNGLTTDVIPVGDIVPLRRAVKCGASVGHPSVTAGTIGCVVKPVGGTEHYILSNNHILADCDKASIGDEILQPGPIDGGDPKDPIGHLTDFEPIMSGGPKVIDAAIAQLIDVTSVSSEILQIGAVQQPTLTAAVYGSVRKYGRTTGHTVGIIMGIDEDVRVRYGGVFVQFEAQLAIHSFETPFSAGGDSGSLVVDAVSRRAVGLLFATGLNGMGFANEIQPILDRFGVEII